MNIHQRHCNLLSSALGEKVIKVDLACDRKSGETARSILFVAPNGFVREHSDAKGKNADSEVYIDLIDLSQNGIKKMTTKSEVVGSNSPTGCLKQNIEKSNQSQVYLAIKKEQQAEAWKDFSNNIEYARTLHFGCSLVGNNLNVISIADEEREEFVVIDLEKYQVNYLSQSKDNKHNFQESISLTELLNAKHDLGMEK